MFYLLHTSLKIKEKTNQLRKSCERYKPKQGFLGNMKFHQRYHKKLIYCFYLWDFSCIVLKTQEHSDNHEYGYTIPARIEYSIGVFSQIFFNFLGIFVLLSKVKVDGDLLSLWISIFWSNCEASARLLFYQVLLFLPQFQKRHLLAVNSYLCIYSLWSLLDPTWYAIHYVFTKLITKCSLLKHDIFIICQSIL